MTQQWRMLATGRDDCFIVLFGASRAPPCSDEVGGVHLYEVAQKGRLNSMHVQMPQCLFANAIDPNKKRNVRKNRND